MGTKPNLNFSPTNNFISNSLFCSHSSLSCSHDSFPAPRFNGASSARASGAPYLTENGNLSMQENLVMTSAYARTFVRTLGEVVGVGLEWLAIIRRGIKLDNLRFSGRKF